MPNPNDSVHPELRQALFVMPLLDRLMRRPAVMRWLGRLARPLTMPGGLKIEDRWIPGPDSAPPVRVRLYRPDRLPAPAPAVLWMHGGGYIMGRPEMDDASCARCALALGILVVSVDYRLAPEHPFPAGLEDCYAALGWLYSQAGALAVDPRRIALFGNSAGSGLAAALAQLAHDRRHLRPIFQVLVYPMLDDRTVTRSDLNGHPFWGWTPENNRLGWQSYLGQAPGAPEAPAYAVPARRVDLSGLPPAWLGVGTLDLFHAEVISYAQRLQACGVPCQLLEVPGAYHGFDVMVPSAGVSRHFTAAWQAALRQALFAA